MLSGLLVGDGCCCNCWVLRLSMVAVTCLVWQLMTVVKRGSFLVCCLLSIVVKWLINIEGRL